MIVQEVEEEMGVGVPHTLDCAIENLHRKLNANNTNTNLYFFEVKGKKVFTVKIVFQ